MRSYLIVGNETLAGEALTQTITDRARRRPDARPRRRAAHPDRRPIDLGRRGGIDAGRRRSDSTRRSSGCAALGIEADGEIGDRDPILAVKDAMRGREIDEIILSTLPAGVSRWLGADVPGRLRDAVLVPVTVVTQRG